MQATLEMGYAQLGLLTSAYFFPYMIFSLIGVLPSQCFGEEMYGKSLGFLTLMLGLGSTISPIIGGYLGDLTNSLGLPLFLGVVTSCFALGLASLKL